MRIDELTFSWDSADPEGFRVGQARLGAEVGAKRTGATIYELPPGQAVCPFHFECGEEEWLLVLDGRPSVRTPEGTRELGPRELLFFPTGPSGAHQVRNDSDAVVRVLMWSEVVWPTATVYPDSDKVGVYVDAEAGLVFRRTSAVGYFDGET